MPCVFLQLYLCRLRKKIVFVPPSNLRQFQCVPQKNTLQENGSSASILRYLSMTKFPWKLKYMAKYTLKAFFLTTFPSTQKKCPNIYAVTLVLPLSKSLLLMILTLSPLSINLWLTFFRNRSSTSMVVEYWSTGSTRVGTASCSYCTKQALYPKLIKSFAQLLQQFSSIEMQIGGSTSDAACRPATPSLMLFEIMSAVMTGGLLSIILRFEAQVQYFQITLEQKEFLIYIGAVVY